MTRDVETTGEGRGRSFTEVLTRGGRRFRGNKNQTLPTDSLAWHPGLPPLACANPSRYPRVPEVHLRRVCCQAGGGVRPSPRDPRLRPRAPRPGARARSATVLPAYSVPALHWTTVYSASSKPGLFWTTRGFSRGPAATVRRGDFALCGEEGREENQQPGELCGCNKCCAGD